jgi:fructokinase
MAADYHACGGPAVSSEVVVERATAGERLAIDALARWERRLAKALATIINVIDPDTIVVGGGLSAIDRIYAGVPALWAQWVFSDHVATRLVRAKHGDASGVRGAAWLWPARSQRRSVEHASPAPFDILGE